MHLFMHVFCPPFSYAEHVTESLEKTSIASLRSCSMIPGILHKDGATLREA